MLRIHHLGHSQSERIVWLCEELAIPYAIVKHTRDPVTRLSPPSLTALHPLGAAPLIEDGDLRDVRNFFFDNADAVEFGAIVEGRECGCGLDCRLHLSVDNGGFTVVGSAIHYAVADGFDFFRRFDDPFRAGPEGREELPRGFFARRNLYFLFRFRASGRRDFNFRVVAAPFDFTLPQRVWSELRQRRA